MSTGMVVTKPELQVDSEKATDLFYGSLVLFS